MTVDPLAVKLHQPAADIGIEIGVATAFALAPDGRVAFRHVIGALPQADGPPPASVAMLLDRLRLETPDGAVREVPFDGTFLRIGKA